MFGKGAANITFFHESIFQQFEWGKEMFAHYRESITVKNIQFLRGNTQSRIFVAQFRKKVLLDKGAKELLKRVLQDLDPQYAKWSERSD